MSSTLEFNITEENGVVKIALKGRLDATNANELLDKLKEYSGKQIKEIVYLLSELEYIASAGLRVIIFSKQKIGMDAKMLVIAPQESVLEVIKMSGLDNFLVIQDTY